MQRIALKKSRTHFEYAWKRSRRCNVLKFVKKIYHSGKENHTTYCLKKGQEFILNTHRKEVGDVMCFNLEKKHITLKK